MIELLEANEPSQAKDGKLGSKKLVGKMQIGVDSFAARFAEEGTGFEASASDSIRNLVQRIELADQAGLDVFGVGEHHRRRFLDSAPLVILAGAAGRTKPTRRTSTPTALSAAGPVPAVAQFRT